MTMKCDLGEARAASTYSHCSQTQRVPRLRLSATLEGEPEVELAVL
jgi:hypothetical protein